MEGHATAREEEAFWLGGVSRKEAPVEGKSKEEEEKEKRMFCLVRSPVGYDIRLHAGDGMRTRTTTSDGSRGHDIRQPSE